MDIHWENFTGSAPGHCTGVSNITPSVAGLKHNFPGLVVSIRGKAGSKYQLLFEKGKASRILEDSLKRSP